MLSPDRAAKRAQYLFDDGSDGPDVQATLTTLRAHHGGFPSEAIVRTLTGTVAFDPDQAYSPIGFRNMERLLNERVGALLDVTFRLELLPEQLDSRSWTAARLEKVAEDVASGVDILFGTSAPDHYWTIDDVEGASGERRFEVHDVWSGSTQWVDEQELIDGSFARRFLPSTPLATKVDLFFVVDDGRKQF
jgi:hypothetical protein